eukprot:8125300-Pyramimonas_sp.AAC.2
MCSLASPLGLDARLQNSKPRAPYYCTCIPAPHQPPGQSGGCTGGGGGAGFHRDGGAGDAGAAPLSGSPGLAVATANVAEAVGHRRRVIAVGGALGGAGQLQVAGHQADVQGKRASTRPLRDPFVTP